ncbi:restriction endonuclease subunit S [Lacticaseibacillus paracasei]|uniref:restriction endonuclease subunit S n=1 Tax=Lacticaseibacillus paracasei TaxID=1597 RepID=UPI0022214FE1|nr:restriction endonuclease subunit S [Lacticaseibacillus paracasei]UYW99872.1 restriction endonuclease subunit S [Lacticaseibacillus paracasei subsp. tolerans]UYX02865.1 restriction endonuclease subunit S [Lacticaseibacillus paracasei subsp. tolerans]
MNQIELQGRSFAGSSVKNYGVVELGDVVYTKSPLKKNPFGIVKVNRNKAGIVSTLYAIYKPQTTLYSPIIDYYFQSDCRVNNYLKPLVNKGAKNDMKVKNVDVLKGNVTIPSEIDEQRTIVGLLNKLDKLIAATQDKIDALEQAKKALLQRLFDQSWRFKGYSDPWEKRKLGELAEFINGRAYKQDELLASGKYPVLRVGNFYTNDKWYYSNLELPEKYYAEEGDLLYTWSATFGPHIWIGPKVIYHYHIWKVALKNIFEKDFALQFFEADRVRLLNSTNGSTMIHVTKKDMESKGILLPDVYEQRTIGDLLKRVDHLIAATQSRLSSLELLKKYLLQDLFI